MSARFTPEGRAWLRKQLLRRVHDLARRLSDVLAGLDGERHVRALGLSAQPGARPEELLRMALEQVETQRRWLDADDERYGRCEVCAIDLGEPSLREMAWADRCQVHPPGAARP
jgi:hypothetical protein